MSTGIPRPGLMLRGACTPFEKLETRKVPDAKTFGKRMTTRATHMCRHVRPVSSFTGRPDIFRNSVCYFSVVLTNHFKYSTSHKKLLLVYIVIYSPLCSLGALTPKRVSQLHAQRQTDTVHAHGIYSLGDQRSLRPRASRMNTTTAWG